MKLELTTERLLLRPLLADDIDLATEMFTDSEIMKFAGGTYTPERVAAELPFALRRGGGGCIGIWCITDGATQEKLGTAMLLPLPIDEDDTNWDLVGGPDLPEAEIEIGYFLRRPAWGCGYATETARRLTRFSFEEASLDEVVAVIEPDNAASRNVLLKTGFVEEGSRRAYATEVSGFRITRQSWAARQTLRRAVD